MLDIQGFARLARRGTTALALAALAIANGCDTKSILTVPDVDVASPGSVSGPSALPSIFAAAIGDFMVAYGGSGGSEGQINYSGLLADEFLNSESFPTRIEIDQRAQSIVDGSSNNASLTDVFRNLSRARVSAERSAAAYAANDSAGVVNRAEVLSLAGFTYLFFAENYCSGIPFSNYAAAAEYGAPLTTNQIFAAARAKFDSAYAVATTAGNAAQQNFARVGLGRTLLNLALYDSAARAVAAVPTTYMYSLTHSENTGRQNNGIWAFATSSRRWTISEREGGNGLPFRSAGNIATPGFDPRIPDRRNPAAGGNGFDASTPHWISQKYPARASGVILADGVEARLIEAEAQYRAGNYAVPVTGTLAILNGLRAQTATIVAARAAITLSTVTTGTLAPLAPATAPTGMENQLFDERAYWLFLTSHRLGDLRRLSRPTAGANSQPPGYGRASNTVFPTGPYPKGGIYGNDTWMPVPFDELRNPNFTTCLPGV